MSRIAAFSVLICVSTGFLFARTDSSTADPEKRLSEKSAVRQTVQRESDTLTVKTEQDAADAAKASGEKKNRKAVLPKRPTARKWVENVLESETEENAEKDTTVKAVETTVDSSRQAEAIDTAKTPHEAFKAKGQTAIPLVVMRTVSEYGVDKLTDEWILLLCEYYIYFRLEGIPGVHVISPDTLSALLPRYKVYTKAIPEKEYVAAAKKSFGTVLDVSAMQPQSVGKRR